MSDLIRRQDAIDAILAVTGNSSVRELYEHVQEHGLSEMWSGGVNAAIDIIIAVPPVHPEPCEDTISRKAAIDAVKHAWAKGLEPTQYIEDLPSAQPEPHWIPVTDRLPEFKYETYDDVDGYTFWDTDFVIGTTSRGTLSIGQFTRDSDEPNEYHWDACECDAFDLQGCLRLGDHIIAWMPLPEPYAGRRTDGSD